jgi:cytochrome c-type biogenesis protein CcmH/NrfG
MNPKFVEAWEGLGEILWKKHDYSGALRAFEGGLKHCEV